ncbi:restriction endonuclease [Methylomonas rapida]|uniref:Restriction endonuclease n=1 Tax=Methylomonas rapida TaxID=2963939 RepID=A0ABY7GGH6_9GAMM|nr:restriction endonuclease [Methylomonas rapida]WAR43561.1 restriction endonuclease [Methylomonas rapida]
MARRKKSTVIEDLYEITAVLPWWVGALLAIIAYIILHRYAIAEVPTTAVPGQIGHMVVDQVTKMLAVYGQYILPLVFIAGAIASFLGRRKREELVLVTGRDSSGNTLRSLSWQEFELLVGEAFRMRGYSVSETGGGGADGGIDLMLKKGGELFLVQCKQWRAFKVSVNIVRELYGVMAAQGATGGFVVTSGSFTEDAKSFAKGRNIELIDGSELSRMIEKAKTARSIQQPQADISPKIFDAAKPEIIPATPSCPKCGGAMVKRIAKQGANTGNAFWGCSAFPKCRGVRAID